MKTLKLLALGSALLGVTQVTQGSVLLGFNSFSENSGDVDNTPNEAQSGWSGSIDHAGQGFVADGGSDDGFYGKDWDQPGIGHMIYSTPPTINNGYIDGAVTDADGNLWNARWGGAAVVCHAPDGRVIAKVDLPATQTSCPAFVPGGIAVTSAWQGMGPKKRSADPQAGRTFLARIEVRPKYEPHVIL
jgi:hypothetical protein